jgi:prepilin peptidase CpaA
VLVVLFVVVTYTDARWLRIPNAVTYPAMVLGLLFGVLESFPGILFTTGFLDHLVALVIAFAISYPFYAAGGLKAGDAKLLMAIGAVRGTTFLLVAAVYGALIGGVIAVGLIVARRLRAAPDAGTGVTMRGVMKTTMPYGIALSLGGFVALALEAFATKGGGP